MPSFPDKAQRPVTPAAVCPRCRGAKCVKTAKGTVTCPTCRGTGQASGQFLTK
jgi:DnaJ-class molecular chaperone